MHTHMQIASGASDASVNPWLGWWCAFRARRGLHFFGEPQIGFFCATSFAEVRRSGYDIHSMDHHPARIGLYRYRYDSLVMTFKSNNGVIHKPFVSTAYYGIPGL
jgi:hypothetical protein